MRFLKKNTTGVREIPPATPKQIAYLQGLEQKLGYKVNKHEHMPLWKAARRINTLKARLEKRERQLTLV